MRRGGLPREQPQMPQGGAQYSHTRHTTMHPLPKDASPLNPHAGSAASGTAARTSCSTHILSHAQPWHSLAATHPCTRTRRLCRKRQCGEDRAVHPPMHTRHTNMHTPPMMAQPPVPCRFCRSGTTARTSFTMQSNAANQCARPIDDASPLHPHAGSAASGTTARTSSTPTCTPRTSSASCASAPTPTASSTTGTTPTWRVSGFVWPS